ncbi:MAG: hypothetical protein R2705_11425 [Ilumatobacteraceae bacterium]
MALVFGALIGGSSDASFDIGVVDSGGTASTAQLAASLTGDAQAGNVTFAAYDDRAAAAGAVDDGDLNAAIVITADGDRPSFEVLRSSDRLVSGQIGTAVARSLAARTDLVYLTIAADTAVSGTAPTAAEVDRLAAASPGGTTRLELDDTGAGKGRRLRLLRRVDGDPVPVLHRRLRRVLDRRRAHERSPRPGPVQPGDTERDPHRQIDRGVPPGLRRVRHGVARDEPRVRRPLGQRHRRPVGDRGTVAALVAWRRSSPPSPGPSNRPTCTSRP